MTKTLKKKTLKISSLYKSRSDSIMSSHVPLTHFQLLPTHDQFCFICISNHFSPFVISDQILDNNFIHKFLADTFKREHSSFRNPYNIIIIL